MIRLVVAVSFLCATIAAHAAQTVVLGISGRPVDAVVKHLNESDALSVEVRTFADHDALYAALRDKTIDLAFMGAVRYVQAHHEFGATPLVAEGKATRSVIVVPSASPIRKLAQLDGKRVAFGYKESTSTYLIPLLMLSKRGLKQEDVNGTFVGHHPQDLIDETLGGRFDACAVTESVYLVNKAKLRVLETSDPFAGPPLVARNGFSPALAAEVRRLMSSYEPPAGDPNQRFSEGAVPVTNADYNRIRFLCKVVLKQSYL